MLAGELKERMRGEGEVVASGMGKKVLAAER
jgi:hypothetical protein